MECPICLEDTTGKPVVTAPCCHKQFDLECYLKCADKCPMCRADKITIRIEEPPVRQIILEPISNRARILQWCLTGVFTTMFFVSSFNWFITSQKSEKSG